MSLKSTLYFVFLCQIIFYSKALAQNNVFLNMEADKTFKGKILIYNLDVYYETLLNSSNKWNQQSVTFSGQYNLPNNWNIAGGLTMNITEQDIDPNVIEMRPWASFGLNSKVINRIMFKQRFKTEWRNFFYPDTRTKSKTQVRARYRILLNVNISKDYQRLDNWVISTGYEWFYVTDQQTGERFSNSRKFIFNFLKTFKNSHILTIGYSYSKLFQLYHPDGTNGHTFNFQYSF